MTTPDEQPDAAAGEGLTAAVRRRRTRRWRLIGISVVVLMLLGGVAGYLGARYGWTPQSISEDRGGVWSWVGLALTVVGVGVEAWGLVRVWRSGSLKTGWNSSLHGLSRKTRIELRRQIRSAHPLDPGTISQARDFAAAIIRNRQWSVLIVGGLGVMALGQALQHAGWFLPICWLTSAVVLMIGLISDGRDRKAAHAFLDAHPAPTSIR